MWKRIFSLTIGLLLICNSSYGAVVEGTSAGFVTSAPVDDPSGTTGTIDSKYRISKFTSPAGATAITEIGMYIDNATEEVDMDFGVYNHDNVGNLPTTLLAAASTIAKGTTAGWKKVTGLNIAITENTVYWLGGQCDDTGTTTNLNYSTVSGYKNVYSGDGESSLPNPFVSGTSGAALCAIYAVYTTGAAAVGQVIVISD